MRNAPRLVGLLAVAALVAAAAFLLFDARTLDDGSSPSADRAVHEDPAAQPLLAGARAEPVPPRAPTVAAPAPETGAPQRTHLVVGVHAMPDGVAVPNARVTLTLGTFTETRTTGADGIVTFLRPADATAASITVGVQHPRFATVTVEEPWPSVSDPIRVTLHAPATLRGRVTDEAGAGLSRARVRLRAKRGGAQYAEATTDARGEFEIAAPASVPLVVRAERDGYATREVEHVVHPHGDTRIVLVLAPGGRVHGVVTAADGTPAAGARVEARVAQDDDGASDEIASVEHAAVTDARGRYAVEGLPLGVDLAFRVAPSASGRARLSAARREVVLDLRLLRLATVRVFVRDEETDDILEAFVAVTPEGEQPLQESPPVTLDPEADGAVLVEAAPGPSTIHVDVDERLRVARDVTLNEGGETSVTIQMSRGIPLEGHVVDEAGNGIAGARVMVFGGSDASANAAGFFRAGAPKPGRFTVIVFTADRTSVMHEAVAPATDLRIVVGATRWTARLVLPEGHPRPRSLSTMFETATGRQMVLHAPWPQDDHIDLHPPMEDTGGQPLRLVLHAEGLPPVERTYDATTPPALGELRFEPPRTLTGRVTDTTGRAIPHAHVADVWDRAVVSDADGRFTLPALPSGEQTVLVRATGYGPRILRLTPSAHEAVVELDDARPLTVRVRRADGVPASGASVSLTAPHDRRLTLAETHTGDDGVAVLDASPGTFTVRVYHYASDATSAWSASPSITVPPTGPASLDVLLSPP